MKYLSKKMTLFLLLISFTVVVGVYLIPILLENMLLQKITTIAYLVLGTLAGAFFFLANGASTVLVDGEYEKNYYKKLKEGKATDEGENFHWNPLHLSLARRIYLSKIALIILLPFIFVFFMEYILVLVSHFVKE